MRCLSRAEVGAEEGESRGSPALHGQISACSNECPIRSRSLRHAVCCIHSQRPDEESAEASHPQSCPLSTIAPFKTIRSRLRHRTSTDVRANHHQPCDEGTPLGTTHYEPPPGPPPLPAAYTVTAADGTTYTQAQIGHLVGEVKDYQLTHASLLKLVSFESESAVPARPIAASVLPTAFPRARFEEALQLQHAFNQLYVRLASDPAWLYRVLEPVLRTDPFLAALWDVYVRVRDAGAVQPVVASVFRSDYMLHHPAEHEQSQLKQVEFNTFSCAGACHAERIAQMHHRLAHARGISPPLIARSLPQNDNIQSIVTLLNTAHDTYVSTTAAKTCRPMCVLMTVQPYNFNIADERPIQYGLHDNNVPCFRCEWQTVLDMTTLTADRTLIFRPTLGSIAEYEVSVIYYRGGYQPGEYRDRSKDTRLRLELSRAIKCPDILTHLTTCKSVQQALSQPGEVERFLPAPQAERVRQTFMPMSNLDDSPSGWEARQIAQAANSARDYVLKPNRDGGGHNVYRANIPAFLSATPKSLWHNYVLMRVIEAPKSTHGTLLLLEELWRGDVVSELGVVGCALWTRSTAGEAGGDDIEMVVNEVAGWTFKTKPRGVDEMSVVKGYGCFDCPWLTE